MLAQVNKCVGHRTFRTVYYQLDVLRSQLLSVFLFFGFNLFNTYDSRFSAWYFSCPLIAQAR